MTTSELIEAASVLVLRDSADGPQVLLTRRAAGMKNFADAWVFPGGRVDLADHTAEAQPAHSSEQTAWQRSNRAAVRETFEEIGLRLEHETLISWAHWLPPPVMSKRFNTRFFIAPAPLDAELNADAREVLEAIWLTPMSAARQARAGDMLCAPPTQINLYELEQCARDCAAVSAVLVRARQRQFITISARLDRDGETLWSVFPWDARYAALDPGGTLDAIPARYSEIPSRLLAPKFMRSGTSLVSQPVDKDKQA